ncbi:MAG TPA: response regulator [Flavisolibacter sp.]|nr:response regulator [Flavisolibacter sp.]
MAKSGVILYIDDDPDDQEVIAQVFQELGVANKIVGLHDGEEALQYLKTEEPPFLILCDYKLPRMDGTTLRRTIEADEELKAKAIPFVFVSTTVSKAMVEEVYNMNVQGLFEKGSRFEEIKEVMGQIYNYWQVCKHPNN